MSPRRRNGLSPKEGAGTPSLRAERSNPEVEAIAERVRNAHNIRQGAQAPKKSGVTISGLLRSARNDGSRG
jgi:hypothetical protein